MRADRGYVLFLAVIVVAGLALALLTVARVQADLAPQARAVAAAARASIAAEDAYARIAFLLLTETMGPRSLDLTAGRGEERVLFLDGRFYRADDAVLVSVQDEAGLINLNASDEGAIAGALEHVGIGAGRASRLAAALADFTDEDDLVRANGAEAVESGEEGMPRNVPLSWRWDVLNAPGWRDALDEDQREALWNFTTASARRDGINVNTAPLNVLRATLRDDRIAQAIVARRAQGAVRDLQELEALTANAPRVAGAGFAVSPGDAFRVSVVVGEERRRYFFERRIEIGEAVADAPVRWRDERRAQGGAYRVEQYQFQALPGPWRNAPL